MQLDINKKYLSISFLVSCNSAVTDGRITITTHHILEKSHAYAH